MSKTVSGVIDEVAGLLNDRETGNEHVRWTEADLLEYLNDAIMQAYLVRPQLFAHKETVTLVPGSVQTLPDGCQMQKVIGVPGDNKPARKLDESMLAIYGGLACECSCSTYKIDGYASNASDPNSFYLDPPVPDDGTKHEAVILCLQEPSEITATAGANGVLTYAPADMPIKGKLHNAVIEWMLYRGYSVDMESAQSDRKMTFHLRHFYEMLGLDAKITDKLVAEQMGKIKGQTPTANVGGNTQ
jgi:hypothetical protein